MSILEKKSNENYLAIATLMNNQIHAPVVHCAYYSSFQLMMHYTYSYSKKTEEQIEKKANNQGSHNYYLSLYTEEIKKIDSRNALQFYKYFSNFKRKRTEADYQNIEISEKDSLRAKDCADKIRKFLKLIDDEGTSKNIHYL